MLNVKGGGEGGRARERLQRQFERGDQFMTRTVDHTNTVMSPLRVCGTFCTELEEEGFVSFRVRGAVSL